jgi:hypothetical protein
MSSAAVRLNRIDGPTTARTHKQPAGSSTRGLSLRLAQHLPCQLRECGLLSGHGAGDWAGESIRVAWRTDSIWNRAHTMYMSCSITPGLPGLPCPASVATCREAPSDVYYVVQTLGTIMGEREHRLSSALYEAPSQLTPSSRALLPRRPVMRTPFGRAPHTSSQRAGRMTWCSPMAPCYTRKATRRSATEPAWTDRRPSGTLSLR